MEKPLQPTNNVSVQNVEQLDLLTKSERAYCSLYVRKLTDFANGNGSVDNLKVMTAGAMVIVQKQRSRCMIAALVSAGKIALPAPEKSEPVKMIPGEGGKMLYPPKQCPDCKKLFTPDLEDQAYCKPCGDGPF